MKTLEEKFFNAYYSATAIPWRIYGSHSHKLLCDNYGELRGESYLDSLKVVNAIKKDGYWRITVNDESVQTNNGGQTMKARKIYRDYNGNKYARISRWISIRYIVVTPRHRLYNCSEDGVLATFKHNGIWTALNECMRLEAPIFVNAWANMEDNATLSGYIPICNFGAVYIELDKSGEHVRLWEYVE